MLSTLNYLEIPHADAAAATLKPQDAVYIISFITADCDMSCEQDWYLVLCTLLLQWAAAQSEVTHSPERFTSL